MQRKEHKFQLKKSHIILIGFLLIFGGIWFFCKDYIGTIRDEIFQEKNMELFETTEPTDEIAMTENETPQVENNTEAPVQQAPVSNTSNQNVFIGILEIPKINLKRGFVDINSNQNKISRNITVIQSSTYPDVDKGNLILAAHSGRGYIAFFKNLYKVQKGDTIYVTYQSMKYTYQVVNIYEQQKTGTAKIYRDTSKTTLTLITCTKDSKTLQTIYIAELVNKQPVA